MNVENIIDSADPNIQQLIVKGEALYHIIDLDLEKMTWSPDLLQAVLPWVPTPDKQGREGYVHGGVSALFLDTVAGFAANKLIETAGNTAVTASLSIEYKSPVPVDAPLAVIARVTGREGKAIFITAAIVSATDPENIMVQADAKMIEVKSADIRG